MRIEHLHLLEWSDPMPREMESMINPQEAEMLIPCQSETEVQVRYLWRVVSALVL